MLIKLKNKEILLDFKHSNQEKKIHKFIEDVIDPLLKLDKDFPYKNILRTYRKRLGRSSITCVIRANDDTRSIINTGTSYCSIKDQFCKECGRVEAIAYAMDGIFNKAEKTDIWKAYKNRPRPKNMIRQLEIA